MIAPTPFRDPFPVPAGGTARAAAVMGGWQGATTPAAWAATPWPLLLQQGGGASGLSSSDWMVVLFSLVGVVVAIAALILGWKLARKWLLGNDGPGKAVAFTLADLRDLHRRGLMTDAEFERAKQAVIEQERAKLADDQPDGGRSDDA